MKVLYLAGVVALFAAQSLCPAHAIELCEDRDYYNLEDSSSCKATYHDADNKSSSRELMFEVLKNYPYEKKDRFVDLLQRKIGLVDVSLAQQHGYETTRKVKANISKLEQAKRDLSTQVEMVNGATQRNWVRVRDRARKVLKKTASSLREVE